MSKNGSQRGSVDLYECNSQYLRKSSVGWRPINRNSQRTKAVHSIRLATWNVWFDELHQELRFKSILQEIKSRPFVDIIALQEVTESFLSILRADKDIQSTWILTDPWDDGHQQALHDSDIWYRNMFLVRKTWGKCTRASVNPLPSMMERFIVTLEISGPDKSVVSWSNV